MMKKYLITIIAGLLLLAIVPLTSNFCSEGIISSTTSVIHEAVARVQANEAAMHGDVCSRESVRSTVVTVPRTSSPSNHSVLPCCADGSHAGLASLSQTLEPIKILPPVILAFQPVPFELVPVSSSYQAPLIVSPALALLRTTILRI